MSELFAPNDLYEIVSDYNAGESIEDVAAEWQCQIATIAAALKWAKAIGVHVRGRHGMTYERDPQRNANIIELREKGLSFDAIADRLCVTKGVVAGVVFRSRQAA